MTWDLCNKLMSLECLGRHDERLSRNSAFRNARFHTTCFVNYTIILHCIQRDELKAEFETFESSFTPQLLLSLAAMKNSRL